MVGIRLHQGTRNRQPLSPTTSHDWGRAATDAAIYLLALGGFYVGWHTIYATATTVGYPADQATVVASLADLAILAYSWKALQEVQAGRPARVIRTIVAVCSFATFYLQLQAAWPDPTATVLHALPALLWVVGHEIMLRGRLRTARARLRAAAIADGRHPAPLDPIRLRAWILAPRRTFQIWRLMVLWELPHADVVRLAAQQWKADKPGKPLPAPWRHVLTTPAPRKLLTTTTAPDVFKTPEPVKLQPAPAQPTGVLFSVPPSGNEAAFQADLPPVPPEGASPKDVLAYITTVKQLAKKHGVPCSMTRLAALSGRSDAYLYRIKREAKAATAA